MAKEFYGFFDPTESDDRQYSADEFAAAFRAMGGTGAGNGLTVSPGGGMNVIVSPGGAMIHGYFYNLVDDGGGPMAFTLGASGGADRYDRVILRLNLSANARTMTLLVRVGTPGASPLPPALVQTDVVKEISLCRIRVRASTGSIQQQDVTDEREDAEVCGLLVPEALQVSALDARYGGKAALEDLNAKVLRKADVVNNLTTTVAGCALDARQAKILDEKITGGLAAMLDALGAKTASNIGTTSGASVQGALDSITSAIGGRTLKPALLWNGLFSEGRITVGNTALYSIFLVEFEGWVPALAYKNPRHNNISFEGGIVDPSGMGWRFGYCTTSGDTWELAINCFAISQTGVLITIGPKPITNIWGLI